MWLLSRLEKLRRRLQARRLRRLEARRTQKLLRLWRAETRRDRLRLWLLLSPLQLLSRFLADSAADENARMVSNPDRRKQSRRIGMPMRNGCETNAPPPPPLQRLRHCLRLLLPPLCRRVVMMKEKLCRRAMVWLLSRLLKLLCWRLRGKRAISCR